MSNAARKDRKRKNEKFEKAAKIPTYPVGLPRPKHSATPYQFAKAIDRAMIASAGAGAAGFAAAVGLGRNGRDAREKDRAIEEGNRVHAEAARKVMAKVEETYESGEVELVEVPLSVLATEQEVELFGTEPLALCQTCYAAPGERCMTRAGKLASKPHAGR